MDRLDCIVKWHDILQKPFGFEVKTDSLVDFVECANTPLTRFTLIKAVNMNRRSVFTVIKVDNCLSAWHQHIVAVYSDNEPFHGAVLKYS